MYDNSTISEKFSEEILCEVLDFLKFKIRNKRLNITEAQVIHHLFDGIEITGTAEDFAKFYGQNPVNVRCVICRKYIGKPRRAVLYSFNKFRKIVPSSWRSCRCSKDADGQHHAGDGE
jgi:hypothetical protein